MYFQVWGAKMIRLFKNFQIIQNISKKNYFFQKFQRGQGPPWSSSGSATELKVDQFWLYITEIYSIEHLQNLYQCQFQFLKKCYIINNLLIKIKRFPFGLKVNFFLLKMMSTSGHLKLSFVINLYFNNTLFIFNLI